jgi:hypothetical protein
MKLIVYLVAAFAAAGWCANASAQAIQGRGAGALTATSTSATVSSLITSNGHSPIAYASLGTAIGNLALINDGSVDAAVCPWGSTCTCPENGVANTVGITLRAGGGGYTLYLPNVAYNTITIVSCGANTIVEANW